MIIVGVSWAPPFLFERYKRWVNPTEEQKIMREKRPEKSKESSEKHDILV